MIRAVIIGFAHMHVNEVALYIDRNPGFELAGCAEVYSGTEEIEAKRYTPKWNLENVRENYCGNIYDDYRIMLDELKPDIAFILSENCQKAEIAEECAKRGVNICIEKPVAATYEDAERIRDAAEKYGIKAVVNWPVAWRKYLHRLKAVADSGVIGRPVKLRYINGHTGPLGKGAKHRGVAANAEEMTDEERSKTWWHSSSHGGGVFLDIACYGCFFAKWLMGNGETSVVAVGENLNTPFGDTDDNFAAVVKYDTAKMSVIEGTWTTPRAVIPSGPMVMCTEGVAVCTGGAEAEPDVKAYDLYGNEIPVPEAEPEYSIEDMPSHLADCAEKGHNVFEMLTLDKNMEIMKILDAAIRSSKSGKEVKICE